MYCTCLFSLQFGARVAANLFIRIAIPGPRSVAPSLFILLSAAACTQRTANTDIVTKLNVVQQVMVLFAQYLCSNVRHNKKFTKQWIQTPGYTVAAFDQAG